MGDLDGGGDNNLISADQWVQLFEGATCRDPDSYCYMADPVGAKVNLVDVAIDALKVLAVYLPERREEFKERTDELGRMPKDEKAHYLFPGDIETTLTPSTALTAHEVDLDTHLNLSVATSAQAAADAAQAEIDAPRGQHSQHRPNGQGYRQRRPGPRLTCMN